MNTIHQKMGGFFLYQTFTTSEKLKQLLSILIPIFITQIGMYLMTFFDTTMSGKASPKDLAGVAIGSSIWMPIYTGLAGILLAVTPIVAQLIGAEQKKRVSFSVIQGIYVAIVMSILVIVAGSFLLNPILHMMDITNGVHHIAKDYLIALSFGIFPLFIYTTIRSFIDALGKTRVSMTITLIALPINIVLNYLLIFGKWGAPKLGGVGAGYATAITYWVICLIAIFTVSQKEPFRQFHLFKSAYRISFAEWKTILKIGLPIGFSIFFETSIFAAVTLFLSVYDTITIASHQAAMNFASLLYMIPLSVSMALTIVVGFEMGSKRPHDAKKYGHLGIIIALSLAILNGIFLYIMREPIASLYTTDPNVLALTKVFLIYAIFFQISDAIQAPIQGILRGHKDVNITFIMALVSYWIIGLPVGYSLANFTNLHAFGYWVGLITGLAVGAIGLAFRLLYVQKNAQKKIELEKSAS
jgi:multidrug resistance protein, MATE family